MVVHSSTSARGRRRAAELTSHPLRAQLNRRQRVLDLVREPARDVAPGGDALRPDERRHVVEHEHGAGERAVLPLQRGRGGGQVQLAAVSRASAISWAAASLVTVCMRASRPSSGRRSSRPKTSDTRSSDHVVVELEQAPGRPC